MDFGVGIAFIHADDAPWLQPIQLVGQLCGGDYVCLGGFVMPVQSIGILRVSMDAHEALSLHYWYDTIPSTISNYEVLACTYIIPI